MIAMLTTIRSRPHLVLLALSLAALAAVGFDAAAALHVFHLALWGVRGPGAYLARLGVWGGMA
jgi:hypothetical protein